MKQTNISKMSNEQLQRYYLCNSGSQTNQWKAEVALAEMNKRHMKIEYANLCGGGGRGVKKVIGTWLLFGAIVLGGMTIYVNFVI